MATASGEPTTATGVEYLPKLDGSPLYRLTVDQYHRIAEHGIIHRKAKVMLLNGLLVAKPERSQENCCVCDNLLYVLIRAMPDGWYVSSRNSLALPSLASEPEPDLMIVRGKPDDYARRRIDPGDVALTLQVADRLHGVERATVKALYAMASVPEYWIVNLAARRVEVYTEPTGPDPTPDYRRRREYGAGAAVPLALEGRDVVQIPVDDILPPAPDE